MTSQHDKPRRWKVGAKWLCFLTISVAFGTWAAPFVMRVAPYDSIIWWDVTRPVVDRVVRCFLPGGVVLGVLIACDCALYRLRLWYSGTGRPQFSVRTLAVIITLACVYAACWKPTKTQGVSQMSDNLHVAPEPIAPLVIKTFGWIDQGPNYHFYTRSHHYYFWFFGYAVKLPYEDAVYEDLPVPTSSSLPPNN